MKPTYKEFLFFAIALGLAAIAITMMAPIMDDFENSWLPAAKEWLAGTIPLYDLPDVRFYNAPWLLGFIIPLTPFSLWFGQVVFTALSLVCVLTAIIALKDAPPVWAVALAILNQPFLNMVGNGEIDALPLLGVALGFLAAHRRHTALLAVSFFLMAIKPNNLLLVFGIYLYVSRLWNSLWLTLAATLISVLFIGVDWPLRLLIHLQQVPPPAYVRTSVWQSDIPVPLILSLTVCAVIALLWLVRRRGLTHSTLAIALATGLTFAPYVLSAHYVMLIPAFLFVAKRNLGFGLLAYAVSWTLLVVPHDKIWLASLYPFFLLVFSWVIVSYQRGRANQVRGESAL